MAPKHKPVKRPGAKATTAKSKLGFGVDPDRAVLPIEGVKAKKRRH